MDEHERAVAGQARLIPVNVPTQPSGLVLVMHGGAGRQDKAPVRSTQLSVLRMIPIASRIAAQPPGDLAVFRLLNSHRGWDEQQTPVDDAHWALTELANRFGGRLPASLVGHSLGGRAALLSGSHPDVVSVVALNAYLYERDGLADLSGRRVIFAHGTADRVASPARAEAVARAVARSADVEFGRVNGGNHAMLNRRRIFERITVESVSSDHSDTCGRPGLRIRNV